MKKVSITARGFPTLEVVLGDDRLVVEMIERDPDGQVIRRWDAPSDVNEQESGSDVRAELIEP